MESETPNMPSENVENKVEESKYESNVDFEIGENHWKEVGFWTALHHPENPKQAFDDLYNEYEAFHKNREDFLRNNHTYEISRFEEKINVAKTRIKELEEKLSQHKNVSEISKEIGHLQREIKELEDKLINSYKELGSAKKDLIQDQINSAFSDLDKIADGYKKVAEDYNELSKKTFADNKEALSIKPDFLKKLRDSYQELHDEISNRLASLNLSGVSYVIRPQLLGYVAAFASGWFFSVFALKRAIGNEDTHFFLLTGLFNFGSKLKTDNFYISLAQHLAFVVFSLLSICFITWLCHFWLERLERRHWFKQFFFNSLSGDSDKNAKKDSSLNDSDELDEEFAIKTSTQISTKAFLSFWIQSIPILSILGIVFIILSLSDVPNDRLDKLNISLAAQTVGLCVAFGFGGLAYLYITNVIEPRLERKRKDNLPSNWFWANIELALIIISILIALVLLLFGVENTLYTYSENIFPFSMFIVCILISSFTIGYGIYYSGLIETANYIQKEMEYLSIKAAYNSFPNVRLLIKADRVFRRKYFDLVVRLLRLLDNKTKIAEKFFSSDENLLNQKQRRKNQKREKQNQNRFWRLIKNWFSPNPSEIQEVFTDEERIEEEIARIEERFETLPEDKEYFPQLTCEIENWKGRLNGEIKRLIEFEKEFRERQEEKTTFAKKLNQEIAELQEKIYNWEKHITEIYDTQYNEFENLFNKFRQETAQLQDGFNIAMWFIANNIEPSLKIEVPRREL